MRRIILVLAVLLLAVAARSFAQDPLQNALEYNPTNQASTWVNPDTGSTDSVVPVRTFENNVGQPCREFQRTIVIGGREEQGYGTACRQPDGSWRIVSSQPAATSAAQVVERNTTIYVRDAPRPYRPYVYYPYAYYRPWPYAYGYPYWYPFNLSLSLGYLYRDGHSRGGHSKHYKGYKGYGGGHSRGYKGDYHR